MPRSWIVPRAILVLGTHAERLAASYSLIAHPSFDPHQLVLIHRDVSEEDQRTLIKAMSIAAADPDTISFGTERNQKILESSIDDLGEYVAVVVPELWSGVATSTEMDERPKKLLTYRTNVGQFDPYVRARWSDPEAVQATLAAVKIKGLRGLPLSTEAASHPTDCADELATPTGLSETEYFTQNSCRIRTGSSAGYLVLAEKFGHFPGWTVRTASGKKELLKANAVTTAIRLNGSEDWVELSYWPLSFSYGLRMSILTCVVSLIFGWRGDAWIGYRTAVTSSC